jgi:hypothetical protein
MKTRQDLSIRGKLSDLKEKEFIGCPSGQMDKAFL